MTLKYIENWISETQLKIDSVVEDDISLMTSDEEEILKIFLSNLYPVNAFETDPYILLS